MTPGGIARRRKAGLPLASEADRGSGSAESLQQGHLKLDCGRLMLPRTPCRTNALAGQWHNRMNDVLPRECARYSASRKFRAIICHRKMGKPDCPCPRCPLKCHREEIGALLVGEVACAGQDPSLQVKWVRSAAQHRGIVIRLKNDQIGARKRLQKRVVFAAEICHNGYSNTLALDQKPTWLDRVVRDGKGPDGNPSHLYLRSDGNPVDKCAANASRLSSPRCRDNTHPRPLKTRQGSAMVRVLVGEKHGRDIS